MKKIHWTLSLLFLAQSAAFARNTEYSKVWLSGLSFLEQEDRRNDYVALRKDLLKDPALAAATFRSLIESEVERKNRGDLMSLVYEIQGALCTNHASSICKEFMGLWTNGLSQLLFFESSPQKIFKATEMIHSGNCREASSVLNEVERVEGRCIPVLGALIELKECQKDTAAVDSLKSEVDLLRGLIRAN